MREDRDGIRCDLGFGKSADDVVEACQSKQSLPGIPYTNVNNPLPTGDHWKVIGWVMNFRKHGTTVLAKIPPTRRDFIKRASAALDTGGFSFEIVSLAARKFRDDNDLRMQRGKVFAFVSIIKNEIEHV